MKSRDLLSAAALASAITAKMARNAAKYPVEKARGRSEKYNEL